MESIRFPTNESKCKSKPSALSDICKQTCKKCGTGDKALPSGTSSSTSTMCYDDNECVLLPIRNKLTSICEWVKLDLSRCGMESNRFPANESKCKSKPSFLRDICKQTCKKCGTGYQPTKLPTHPITHHPTYVPTISTTYFPTYASKFLRTSSPTQSPTECEDDEAWYVVARGHKIFTLCEWAGRENSTCQQESKDYVTPESMPKHYDAYYVYNICKKTCGKCGTNVDLKPTTAPTV